MPEENNQNGEIVEKFVLPREDWYDNEGRIYKDALIENFNAIEAKLLQVSRLDAFDVDLPDITKITYPDIEDIETAEDNQIINLKSLLEMSDLIGYPIELVTSGKTIKKLCYWGTDYQYHQILDKTVPMGKVNCYVYLNYVLGNVFANDSEITPENSVLIGCYVNGIIKHVNTYDYGFINLLYYLSKMKIETLDVSMQNSEHFREHQVRTGHNLNGATIGGTDLDTGSGNDLGTVRFNRIGRLSS